MNTHVKENIPTFRAKIPKHNSIRQFSNENCRIFLIYYFFISMYGITSKPHF